MACRGSPHDPRCRLKLVPPAWGRLRGCLLFSRSKAKGASVAGGARRRRGRPNYFPLPARMSMFSRRSQTTAARTRCRAAFGTVVVALSAPGDRATAPALRLPSPSAPTTPKRRILPPPHAPAGVPVNVIDRPAFCDFAFGAIVNRSPLVIGISTDGAAPVFGQAIRAKIEALIPKGFARWAEAARTLASARAGARRCRSATGEISGRSSPTAPLPLLTSAPSETDLKSLLRADRRAADRRGRRSSAPARAIPSC